MSVPTTQIITTHPNHRRSQAQLLIIGAGYAGLTLANCLQISSGTRKNSHNFHIDVIDRLHPPDPERYIHGSIQSPYAKELLTKIMALVDDDKYLNQARAQMLLDKLQESCQIPEQELLSLLRENVSVKYRCEATKIVSPNGLLFAQVRLRNLQNQDLGELWGPYDWVVVADGALSPFRYVNIKTNRLLVIGDAKGQPWWDFGRTRLKRGADIAMRHGDEVAGLLLEWKENRYAPVSLDKFRPRKRWWQVFLIRWLLLLIMPLSLAFWATQSTRSVVDERQQQYQKQRLPNVPTTKIANVRAQNIENSTKTPVSVKPKMLWGFSYLALVLVVTLNSFCLWFLSLHPIMEWDHSRRRTIPYNKIPQYTTPSILASNDGETSLSTPAFSQNHNLPDWISNYLEWHMQTRQQLNESNWQDYKYLVSRCYNNDPQCGGLVDRLRALPFLVQVAAMTGRLLLFHWERPYELSEFLDPVTINWKIPPYIKVPRHLFIFTRVTDVPFIQKSDETVVSMRLQAYKEAQKFFDRYKVHSTDADTFQVLRPLWKLFFQPSPPIRQHIELIYQQQSLAPLEYFAVHLRTLYDSDSPSDENILETIHNALSCASKFPGFSSSSPIVVTSDSKQTLNLASQLAPEHVVNTSLPGIQNYSGPILHLDRGREFLERPIPQSSVESLLPVEAYYPTFVDFYLLMGAKCVAFDKGGFGRLASMLSDNPSCSWDHRHHKC
jgi:hypothetical protein